MSSKLPSLFRLPGYNVFEYRPRYYDENKERRKKRKINFKRTVFETDSPIKDSFVRERMDATRKSIMLSRIIRIVLVLLFCILCYYLALALGLLWKMA